MYFHDIDMNLTTLLPIIALTFGELALGQVGHPIAAQGTTTVSAVLANSRVEATFRTSTLQIAKSPAPRRFVQCTYSRFPCSLTGQIRIRVGERDVLVPASAYSDLGDITTASLGLDGRRMVLTIVGGDASESYIAKLIFNRQRIVERRVYSGEDPSRPLEVSHYYEPSTKN